MKYIFILISLLTAAALVVSQSADVDVQLTWSAPTTRTDGSVLTAGEILGYELECTSGKTATVTVSITRSATADSQNLENKAALLE